MIGKAPVIALDGNLDQWEKLRDKYHKYYLVQFVRWLKKRHIWAEGIVLIPLKEADWQALLKESEGGE